MGTSHMISATISPAMDPGKKISAQNTALTLRVHKYYKGMSLLRGPGTCVVLPLL